MITSRQYTIITPRLDNTGPSNLAVDIGRAAAKAGWTVSLRYLSGAPSRDDLAEFRDVRRLQFVDIAKASGVIHTHCLRPDLIGWFFTFKSKCTVITTLHNHFLIDLSFSHKHWKVRCAWHLWVAALRRFDHRVCISQTMQRYYHRLLPELEFDVAYNFRSGPDSLDYQRHTSPVLMDWLKLQRAEGQFVLVFVGSLTQRKNITPLIKALANASQMSLVLCGRGSQGTELEQLTRELGLSKRVLFLGHVESPRDVVESSDLLVIPSLAEGLPLVVLEAASIGKPCLMSNIAVHRELSKIGIGTTFDHRRFSDFEGKVFEIFSDNRREQNSDHNLKQIWRNFFSSQIGFRRYEKILSEGSKRHLGKS